MPTEDITIVPIGSKLYDKPVRITPVYLVTVEDPTAKSNVVSFLATKVDESQYSVKIVGFEINKELKKINENYQDVLSSTDKSLYIELMLPWRRVIKIQNLIFKQK